MITQRLQEILNIHAGEGRMVALVLGYAILLFSSVVLVTTASLGLFFGTFDAATMPYTYILLMFFGPLASLIVLRLNNHLTLAKALLGIHVFLLLTLILLPLALNLSASPVLRFSLPIYLQVYIALTYSAFWNLLGRIYNLRQGKRLFPILLSGEHLATIGAGFFASFFVIRFGTANLYWLGALCMVGSVVLLTTISRANANKLETSAGSEVQQTRSSNLQTLVREPYVRLMLAMVALYTVSVVMVENLSYAQAEIRFPTENAMATYVGIFMAIYGILGLIFQWIVAGRVLDRFGVTATLLTMPGGLFLIMLIFALVGSFNHISPALFWLASAANMYSYTVDGPYTAARNVMMQPLPTYLRTQAQTTAIGIVYPLMTGISGLLLLFLLDILGFDSVQLSYAILLTLILWFAVAVWFGQAYVSRLRQAVQMRSLGNLGSFRSPDRTNVSVLEEALQDQRPTAVLYALNTLTEVAPEVLSKHLSDLLSYPDDEVRLAALGHIARMPWSKTPPDLEALLTDSPNSQVRATALKTWYAVSPQLAGARLAEFGRDPQPAVRREALAIMSHHDDTGLRRQAEEALASLAASTESADRVLAASVIGELGENKAVTPPQAQFLLTLLADRDPQVRCAALAAAEGARSPLVWPALISALAHRNTRPLAVNALIAGGEEVLPLLFEASQETGQEPQRLVGIALVCSRFSNPGSIAILETLLDHPNSSVRHQALLGLSQSIYDVAQQQRTTLQQAIQAQASELAEIVAAQVDLGDTWQVRLAADSLERQRQLATDNLLLLLSFLYEPQTVLSARNALQMSRYDDEKQSYAFEILDILLSHEDKALLFPVLHQLSSEQRLVSLHKQFPQTRLGREKRLHRLLKNGQGEDTRWTRICAIYALGMLQDAHAAEEVVGAAIGGSDDPVLVETALSSLEQLGVSLERIAVNPTLETAVAQWHARDSQSMTLLQKADGLKQARIFADLPDDALEAMAGMVSVVSIDPGETLMRKGDLGDCMYVVMEGQLHIHKNGLIVDTLYPGGVTGEMALLDSGPRSASVTAVTGCRLLRLDQEPFYDLLAGHPQVAYELLSLLSRRLRERTADLAPQAQRKMAQPVLPAVGGQTGVRRSIALQGELLDLDKRLILESIDFFSGINDDLVGQVAALLEEVDLAGGEMLFHQGDAGHSLYIVAIGQVRIHMGERTLAYAGEGEVIGEMALLESEPRMATVTAVMPTRLLRLDRQPFFELLEVQPDLTRGIIRTLSGRQRARLQELA